MSGGPYKFYSGLLGQWCVAYPVASRMRLAGAETARTEWRASFEDGTEYGPREIAVMRRAGDVPEGAVLAIHALKRVFGGTVVGAEREETNG
jgi:hypothetical protein